MSGIIYKSLLTKEDMRLFNGGSTLDTTRPTSTGGTQTNHMIDWVGVDVCQVYGGGTDRTLSAINQAIAASGSRNVDLFLSRGTWAITDDLSIAANFRLVVPMGARLSVSAGKTLTILGPIDAGAYQIFEGTGTVTLTGADGIQYGLWTSGGTDTVNVPNLVVAGETVSAAGIELINDASVAAMRTTLGLGTAATQDYGVTANNVVRLDSNAKLPAIDGSQLTNLPGTTGIVYAYPKSYLSGFVMSNNGSDAEHDIDIAAGVCRDDADEKNMSLAAITKRIDAAWAAGTNQGGMNTGTVSTDTWYHVYIIYNATSGVNDAMFTTWGNRATLPTGYTHKRRIGSVLTDGSANIIAFYQNGERFVWDVPILDHNSALGDTSAHLIALSVPTDITIDATLRAANSVNFNGILISSPNITDTAPNATAAPLFNVTGAIGVELIVTTDTSGQVRARAINGAETLYIATTGWIDTRGRND